MSLISDIKSTFGTVSGKPSQDYLITEYQKEDSDVFINFYGVFNQRFTKVNAAATRPLERSNFTTDSKQIKPYVYTITGMFLPDEVTSPTINSYEELASFIADEISYCNAYADGVQLFTLSNLFSFGIYEPLTLIGVSQANSSESPLPEVTLMFLQSQSSTATSYSTVDATPTTTEPQNLPIK